MKHVLLAAILFLTACSATAETTQNNEVTAAETAKAAAMARVACNAFDAIESIVAADQKSEEAATAEWQIQLRTGRCGMFQPRPLEFSVLELAYNDHAGRATEVWKVKDYDIWVVLLKSHIKHVGYSL